MNHSTSNSKEQKELIYFIIADYGKKKEIGSYFNKQYTNDLKDINNKSQEILREDSNSNNFANVKSKKNKLTFKNFIFFYIVNKNNTLFLAVLNKNFASNENMVFELIEDIEHQGITKFVDKNGELNNVGKQNLIYLIEKYFSENEKSRNSSGDFYDKNTSLMSTPKEDKIVNVTSEINGVKDEMKIGIKKLVNNIDNARELENKAIRINDTSLSFRKDADTLRRNVKWRNMKYLIILAIIGLIVISYLFYKIIS
jgi:hypothetical protein